MRSQARTNPPVRAKKASAATTNTMSNIGALRLKFQMVGTYADPASRFQAGVHKGIVKTFLPALSEGGSAALDGCPKIALGQAVAA